MVRRRNIDNDQARKLRTVNQGFTGFTDFFDERHPMNENPTAPFFQFMDNHEVNMRTGEVKRRKK